MTARRWLLPLQALVLVAVLVAAFWPIRHGTFLWDDDRFIVNNELMQAPDGLSRIWLTDQAADYYPVTWTLFWLERHAWGTDPAPYHAVNLLLHVIGVLLLWRVLRELKLEAAWWIALIFAVHPMCVESAGWIIEGKNTLSFVFYMLAMLGWLRSDRLGGRLFCYAMFAVALLCKTSGAALPLACLAIAWWQHDRLRREDVLHTLPLFALSAAASVMSVYTQKHYAVVGIVAHPEPFLTRLALAGRAFWFYLYKTVVPWPMAMVYPRWHVTSLTWLDWLPDLALIALALAAWRWRQRVVLVWLAVVIALLLPVLGFFDISYMRFSLVANHWAYLALPAILALPIAALGRLKPVWIPAAAGVAVVAILGCLTWQRTVLYAADIPLWTDNVQRFPHVPVAWSNLGTALERAGDPAGAEAAYRRCLAEAPDDAGTFYRHGNSLLSLHRPADAVKEYRQALRIDPSMPEAHNNMGVALQQIDNDHLREAEAEYAAAIDRSSHYVDAWQNLGRALESERRYADAWRVLRDGSTLTNDAEVAWLGGSAAESLGQLRDAVGQYKRALFLDPGHLKAQNNLAWILATAPDDTLRDGRRALFEAHRACGQTHFQDPQMLDTLAAAYAECGQFDDALRTEQTAMQLAGGPQNDELRMAIDLHRSYFSHHQPLRTKDNQY